MDMTCKIIGLNRGQGSLTMTFPGRTGQVLTLAVPPEDLKQFEEGAVYRLTLELVSKKPKTEN